MAHARDRMELDEADEQPPTGDAWLTRQMQQRAQRMHNRRTGSSGGAPVPPPDAGHGQLPSAGDPKHEYGAHAASAVQHEQLEATIARRKERIAALEAQLANERAQLAADEADLADLNGVRPDPQAAAAAAEQERLDMELARQLQIQADREEEQQAAEAEEQERRRAREEAQAQAQAQARAHAQMPAAFGLPQGFGSAPGTHFAVQRHPNGGMSFSFSSSSAGQPHGGGGGMDPTGPSAMDEHAARHRAHVERMLQDMARGPIGMPSGFFGMPPNFGGGLGGGFGGGGGFGFAPDGFAGVDFGQLPQGQQTFRQPARPEDVERLPEARYQAAPAAPAAADETGAVQEEDESRKCAICLQQFEDGDTIRRLPCLHIFHRDEIDRWLRESHVCPICRTPIEQDDSSA